MGRQTAEWLASTWPLREAVWYHLTGNFVPSMGFWLPAALRAIRKTRAGQMHLKVRLPEQVSYRGYRMAKAIDVIDHLRLWPWVEGYIETVE